MDMPILIGPSSAIALDETLWRAFQLAPPAAQIQCIITLIIMALLVVVMVDSVLRWTGVLGRPRVVASTRPGGPALEGAPGS